MVATAKPPPHKESLSEEQGDFLSGSIHRTLVLTYETRS